MINKRQLREWISNFIFVSCELSADLRDDVEGGVAELEVPEDILKVLNRRGILFFSGGRTFFEYKSWVGPVLVELFGENDPRKSMRLTLKKSRHEKQ